jgi:hypothetical protein
MPRLTNWYWVVAWYLAKATAQPWALSGGMTPMIGSHSVMDRPEPVSRVAPPTTTRPKTTRAVAKSQIATGRDRCGSSTPSFALETTPLRRAMRSLMRFA